MLQNLKRIDGPTLVLEIRFLKVFITYEAKLLYNYNCGLAENFILLVFV